MSPQNPRTRILFYFFFYGQNSLVARCHTYLVGRKVGAESAVGHFIVGQAPFEGETAMSPLFVLALVDVRHHVLGVHVVVPVDHVEAGIVSLLVVGAQSLVPVLADLILVHSAPA